MARTAIQRTCLLLFLALLSACGDSTVARREALVLTEDSGKRCDTILTSVVGYWDLGGSQARAFVDSYYNGDGRTETMPLAIRLEQARQALSAISRGSGEERDLLFELYAGVDKLCELARHPEGYSQLTYTARRSALRDEIAGSRAKLGILIPVTEGERTLVLAQFAAPVEEEARKVRWQIAEAERLKTQQKEAAELVARLQQEQKEKESRERIQRKRQEAGLNGVGVASTAELHGYMTTFCDTSRRFGRDFKATTYTRHESCRALKSSTSILRSHIKPESAEDARLLANRILDLYRDGADECIKGAQSASFLFGQGERECAVLAGLLREYGFFAP